MDTKLLLERADALGLDTTALARAPRWVRRGQVHHNRRCAQLGRKRPPEESVGVDERSCGSCLAQLFNQDRGLRAVRKLVELEAALERAGPGSLQNLQSSIHGAAKVEDVLEGLVPGLLGGARDELTQRTEQLRRDPELLYRWMARELVVSGRSGHMGMHSRLGLATEEGIEHIEITRLVNRWRDGVPETGPLPRDVTERVLADLDGRAEHELTDEGLHVVLRDPERDSNASIVEGLVLERFTVSRREPLAVLVVPAVVARWCATKARFLDLGAQGRGDTPGVLETMLVLLAEARWGEPLRDAGHALETARALEAQR